MGPFEPTPAVVGHRGAPRVAPENTPASFAAAAAAGASWVELDVRRSSDDVVVLHHDPRTVDGAALVHQSAAALRARGVWDLAGALAALPEGLGVDVEVKNLPGEPDYDEGHAIARLLAEVLRPHLGSRPLITSSFNPATVQALAEALPAVPAGLLHGDTLSPTVALDLAVELGARVLCSHLDSPGLGADAVAAAHAAGCAVLVWTVDDPDRAVALAADGVDALCTNDPAALRARLPGRAQGAAQRGRVSGQGAPRPSRHVPRPSG